MMMVTILTLNACGGNSSKDRVVNVCSWGEYIDESLIDQFEEETGIKVKNPDLDAQLVAENIAQQLEKRIGFRRAMKNSMGRAMRAGARGIKTFVPTVQINLSVSTPLLTQ